MTTLSSRVLAVGFGALFPLLGVVGGCQRRIPEPEPRPVVSAVALPATSLGAAPSSAEGEPPAEQPKVTELVKQDLALGKGAAVKSGDAVKVHYTGRLLDGTKFDSSLDRNEPFGFTVGASQVIKGWDQGLIGMKKGGKRKLTIPAELAYGKIGSPPTIPPNAPLEFEIELLEIQ